MKAAITAAQAETERPTLICCKTIIGFGSPNKQGTSGVHGAALGDDEVAAARAELGWTHAPFEIPADIYADWDAKTRGAEAEASWSASFAEYAKAHPALAAEYQRRMAGEMPADFHTKASAYIAQCQAEGASIATRKASQNCLDAYGPSLPELLGGSADLAGSNNTIWQGSDVITADNAGGNYINYGVREFGMSAMMTGMALHGGFIPYGATFLVFMEYARNAVRMAAIMKQRSILVYTHDSIGLGEDGPTHQPVEQLANLRTTPNLHTWRPCDTVESAVAWKFAIEAANSPTALIFTRQGLPHQPRNATQVADIEKGGYVLIEGATNADELDAIIIATGSEVSLAVESASALSNEGYHVRVVSMPCTTAFDQQDAAYRESVLPAQVINRVAVEAAHVDFWYKYVGLDGRVVGMKTFGESAPAKHLFEHFGITASAVSDEVRTLIEEQLPA